MIEKLKSYKNVIINEKSSMYQAIKILQKKALQILLVVNNNDEYVGTVTDGDIRRALLKKKTLDDKIILAVNRKSIFITKTLPKLFINELMTNYNIASLPIIKKKKITGLYLKRDAKTSKLSNKEKVIIMAGGKGTRLMPLTKKKPKALIKINGKPVLEHIILNLVKYNFKNLVISINHLGNQIKDYFGFGYDGVINISYIEEKKPLGTVGSLSLVNFKKKKENLILMNCDIYSNIDLKNFLKFHKKNNADITVAAKVDARESDYGVIKTNGKIFKKFEEKLTYYDLINSGIYIINSDCIKYIKKNIKTDIPDFFEECKKNKKKILVYPIYDYWYDIGKISNFKKIKNKIK